MNTWWQDLHERQGRTLVYNRQHGGTCWRVWSASKGFESQGAIEKARDQGWVLRLLGRGVDGHSIYSHWLPFRLRVDVVALQGPPCSNLRNVVPQTLCFSSTSRGKNTGWVYYILCQTRALCPPSSSLSRLCRAVKRSCCECTLLQLGSQTRLGPRLKAMTLMTARWFSIHRTKTPVKRARRGRTWGPQRVVALHLLQEGLGGKHAALRAFPFVGPQGTFKPSSWLCKQRLHAWKSCMSSAYVSPLHIDVRPWGKMPLWLCSCPVGMPGTA